MKLFLAVYTGTPATAEKKWGGLSDSERQQKENEGMKSWGEWAQNHRLAIKDPGAPLGKTKRVDENGIHDIRNNLTAYTLLEAETHEDAAKMFMNHPHFAIFPGEAVEIVECLPMPRI